MNVLKSLPVQNKSTGGRGRFSPFQRGIFRASFFTISVFTALFSLISCGAGKKRTVIIWTDRPEIASYIEHFNISQNRTAAVAVYKPRLSTSLPPAGDEQKPDVVIGSWLKNSRIRKNFAPLNNLFSEREIHPDDIYPTLLSYGRANSRQYLLPVSFNLPVVIFSTKNTGLIPESYLLTPDEIRDTAAQFNKKNNHDIYTNMGFAPSWDADFLYTVAKFAGADFREKGNTFQWNEAALQNSITYIKNWTTEKNTSTTSEQDFDFKYLYTPKYRQVDSGRTLFAYSSSDDLFGITWEQLGSVDFRWISQNESLIVDDDIVMAGIYKQSTNTHGARRFLVWLLNAENQKALMERSAKMHLQTTTFGICSGFSSLKEVNERVFPVYYKNLLGNLPSAQLIVQPNDFPSRWESLRDRIVIPYLIDATRTDSEKSFASMEERISVWQKQFD